MGGAGGLSMEAGGGPTTAESYTLAYSIMDSSRVSTFFISILLIVYGSFRSLSMEEEGKSEDGEEKEKKESNNVTTLDSVQAMCLPLGASLSLLIMFFFFDSMQVSKWGKSSLSWPGPFLAVVCRLHRSDRHGSPGLPPPAHVSVPRQTLRHQGQDIPGALWEVHPGRNPLRWNFHLCGLYLGVDGTLGPDGLHGNGSLCRLHSICETAQSQGLHSPSVRPPALRRILGVFLPGKLTKLTLITWPWLLHLFSGWNIYASISL